MDKTTLTYLEDTINIQHPIKSVQLDAKTYAIHTILYAIVCVWFRLFINKKFDELVPTEIKDNVDFINTLLNQCTNDTKASCANGTKAAYDASCTSQDLLNDSAKNTGYNGFLDEESAKYAIDSTDSTESTNAYVFFARHATMNTIKTIYEVMHYGASYKSMNFAEAASKYANNAAGFAPDSAEWAVKNHALTIKSCAESTLFYLISAYLYLKK